MINKKKLIFFLIFILLNSCSFDKTTGIWDGSEEEEEKISELEKKQKQIVDVYKIYSSKDVYSKEIALNKNIVLSEPEKNLSWKMPGLNHQNFLGNIFLSGVDNIFLKKKIGKNKSSLHKTNSTLLAFENNIIFSDDRGTIFNINERGKINWKKTYIKKFTKNYIKI